MKQGTKKITNREFVNAWMDAYRNNRNASWLARKLHRARPTVVKRAEYLRERGANLPPLRKHGPQDAGELNKLIEKRMES